MMRYDITNEEKEALRIYKGTEWEAAIKEKLEELK